MLKPIALLATALLISVTAQASDKSSDQAPDVAARQALQGLAPGLQPDSLTPAAIDGFFEAVYGSHVLYVSRDGRYLMDGDLIDITTHRNLTEERMATTRVSALDKLGEDQMVVFSPKNPKHTVTVFTDIDCPYCRKLHQEMDGYLKEGIKVRYLFFPRAGIGSKSYDKAVSVWCSADRNQAMTDAKAGKDLGNKTCDNPVATHYKLGEELGVQGTPAIVTDDGRMIPGYLPPERLAAVFEKTAKK